MRRLVLSLGILPALALPLAGCGGDEKSPPPTPKGKPNPAAARAAQAYVDAYTAKNQGEICSLLAGSVRAQLAAKRTCERTIELSFKGKDFPKFTVDKSSANGTTAIVTFRGSPRQVTLTKESGRWKVVDGGT